MLKFPAQFNIADIKSLLPTYTLESILQTAYRSNVRTHVHVHDAHLGPDVRKFLR